jgi:DNA ligase D-like protein (predicted 3'-phosphoesterase)
MTSSLKEYRRKRDFQKTAEPAGGRRRGFGQPIFVVQRHEASTLHYDFRLEVNGVLKSWAVPKGPPGNPGVRRLAVPTEDHPLEYADFAGKIPEGAYGAGTVEIWDSGTYRNLSESDQGAISMAEALAAGKVEFHLDGGKLSGDYALIRPGDEEDERWLLIKMKDKVGGDQR